jgi:hypothetical protein
MVSILNVEREFVGQLTVDVADTTTMHDVFFRERWVAWTSTLPNQRSPTKIDV